MYVKMSHNTPYNLRVPMLSVSVPSMFDFENIDSSLPLKRPVEMKTPEPTTEDDLSVLMKKTTLCEDTEDDLEPDQMGQIITEIPDFIQRMTPEDKMEYYRRRAEEMEAKIDPSQLTCVYCQSLGRHHLGHTRETCTVLKETRCNYCANYGHTGKYCPSGRKTPLAITCMRCFRQGKDEKEFMGHVANECGVVNTNTQSVNANHPVIRKYVDDITAQLQQHFHAQMNEQCSGYIQRINELTQMNIQLSAQLEQFKQYYAQQYTQYAQYQQSLGQHKTEHYKTHTHRDDRRYDERRDERRSERRYDDSRHEDSSRRRRR